MPSNLSQLFFPGRSSYSMQEDGVAKRIARSKSFSFTSKRKHRKSPEVIDFASCYMQ